MKNGSVILIVALLMFLICYSGCSISKIDENNGWEERNTMPTNTNENIIKPVKLAIFPIGMTSDTYFFHVNSEGILEVKIGNRNSDDISDANFIEPTSIDNKKLSEEELESITKLVNEIGNDKTVLEKIIKKGGWEVIIMIENKKYNFNYGNYDDTSYGKLVKLLIQYSPLEIDIHSWS
jgi:hypothetical protein